MDVFTRWKPFFCDDCRMSPTNARVIKPVAREQLADAVIHIIGVTLAMLAVPVLITLAAVWRDEAAMIAAVSIYGATLLAMILFSASYNLAVMRYPDWWLVQVLRRLDHGTIYLKIAGTYTPFAVIAGGQTGFWLLIGIWSAAATGFFGKMFAPDKWERASIALYLLMGWAFVLAAGPISASLTQATLVLILVGGGLYTIGVVFHLWERLPYQNAIWHVFVLAASFVFYSAMIVEVVIGT